MTPAHEGSIDYWCNWFGPEMEQVWNETIAAQGIQVKVRTSPDDGFCDPPTMVQRMDELGVGALIMPTCHLPEHVGIDTYERVAARREQMDWLAAQHPGRFFGVWSVDPGHGMAGVREAADALGQPWCVGLHTHTHSWDRTFDDRDYYPYYALCGQEGVPFVMQAGSSGGLLPSECGRPIGIDRPAIYFRDTDFVLSHTGWPWVDECIAMALKFPNVYLGTAVYPARHWSAQLVEFIGRAGRRKCVWGTGFPAAGHRHTLRQLDEIGLRDEARANYLGGTARRIFRRLGG